MIIPQTTIYKAFMLQPRADLKCIGGVVGYTKNAPPLHSGVEHL